MTQTQPHAKIALHLAGLPGLDALSLYGQWRAPSQECNALCTPLFHTEIDGPGQRWQELEPTAARLYQQYGTPLEPDRTGEYVAVVATGRAVSAAHLRDVVIEALQTCPDETFVRAGFFIFRIGQRVMGADVADDPDSV